MVRSRHRRMFACVGAVALFSCTGPKGADGAQGPKGDPGPAGSFASNDDGGLVDPGPGSLDSKHSDAHDAGISHADRIIFFLGDGMGITTVTAARIYAKGEDGQLTMDTLTEMAFIRTYSRDSRVTDSAPSMSAYMTGVKMNNDVLSMSAETPLNGKGHPVSTLMEWAKAAGWGTGVVTTTRVTHATPAACYAHISNRDLEDDIARQLAVGGSGSNSTLKDGVDIIFGGGRRHFLPKGEGKGQRTDARNLIEELKRHDYEYVETSEEMKAVTGSKVLGLFNDSHMTYELQRGSTQEPSLKDMAVKAVQLLEKKSSSYFLMVEGGRIDHALHETTAKKALAETVAFDEALAAVLAEVRTSDPNLEHTLIVLTSDHDHTLVHQGYTQRTGPTSASDAGILGLVRDPASGAPVRDLDGRPFTILAFGNGERRVSGARSNLAAISESDTSSDEYHQEAAIRTTPGNETHGGTDVTLRAIGFGSERFHGFLTNTEVFGLVRDASKL